MVMSLIAALACCVAQSAYSADTLPVTLLGAVGSAVANNVNVRIQEQEVRIAQGALEQASSAFDPTISADAGQTREKTPTNSLQREQSQRSDKSIVSDVTTFALRASQRLRNGAVLGSSVSTTRTVDTVNKLSGLPAVPGEGQQQRRPQRRANWTQCMQICSKHSLSKFSAQQPRTGRL